MLCTRNMLLPYEYKWSCVLCGYNVIRPKHDFRKIFKEKTNFINRLKYAKLKIFCICLDEYRLFEGDIKDKLSEGVSELQKKN